MHCVKYVVYAYHLHVDSNLGVPFSGQIFNFNQKNWSIEIEVRYWFKLIIDITHRHLLMKWWGMFKVAQFFSLLLEGSYEEERINFDLGLLTSPNRVWSVVVRRMWPQESCGSLHLQCDRRQRKILDLKTKQNKKTKNNPIKMCIRLQCGEFVEKDESGVISDQSPHGCYSTLVTCTWSI